MSPAGNERPGNPPGKIQPVNAPVRPPVPSWVTVITKFPPVGKLVILKVALSANVTANWLPVE